MICLSFPLPPLCPLCPPCLCPCLEPVPNNRKPVGGEGQAPVRLSRSPTPRTCGRWRCEAQQRHDLADPTSRHATQVERMRARNRRWYRSRRCVPRTTSIRHRGPGAACELRESTAPGVPGRCRPLSKRAFKSVSATVVRSVGSNCPVGGFAAPRGAARVVEGRAPAHAGIDDDRRACGCRRPRPRTGGRRARATSRPLPLVAARYLWVRA